jgi:RNA polymerase sigma-70 factor (ECF subfamily)
MVDSELFESYRPLMFGLAYRMLGSAMEAEDIVQEAYLRYLSAEPHSIRSLKAFLTTVVTRLSLDHLKSARVQRESYFGPWLPEPLLTGQSGSEALSTDPDALTALNESLSLALLTLLEKLNPVERAVFLLREVFEYDFAEIATMVGKSEAACRQALHRARQFINAESVRFSSTAEEHRVIFGQFMQACLAGDLDELLATLSADVSAWADGGGKAKAATRPIFGREGVAALLLGLLRRMPPDAQLELAEINGRLGILVRQAGAVVVVMSADVAQGKITALRFIRNPDKLRRLDA